MDKKQLYKFVDGYTTPAPSDISRLRVMVDSYPYFDAAKFIYLKALYDNDIECFNKELSIFAPLLSDRGALFYYIFRDDYAQYFRQRGKNSFEVDQTYQLLNAFFDNIEPESSAFEYENPTANLASVDYLSYLDEEKSAKEKEEKKEYRKQLDKLIFIEEKEKRGEERELIDIIRQKARTQEVDNLLIIEEKNVDESLVEEKKWKKVATPTIVEDNATVDLDIIPHIEEYSLDNLLVEEEKKALTPLRHQNLIDKFLETTKEKEIKLNLNKEDLKGDKDYLDDEGPIKEQDSEDMFFTETLAKIYTKQGRYEKAYKIIEHLSLKYPKKNSYFADQLSYLEKLIINKKYKNKK